MLWMTQYQILVMMSAKGRSPVFPDMFSSVSIYIYLVKRIVFRKRKKKEVRDEESNSKPFRFRMRSNPNWVVSIIPRVYPKYTGLV